MLSTIFDSIDMPPAVVDALENGSNPADQNEKAKPVIGIIYPPPEVRSILSLLVF